MYTVLQDMKDSTDENIREIAVEFEAYLEDQKRNGVSANEKFKEIVDYIIEVQGMHNFPEGMIDDIRTVGKYIESTVLSCLV